MHDSHAIEFEKELLQALAKIARKQKIAGIFSSPPYVGLIDYHEQHAYAYDLFGFARKDNLLAEGQKSDAGDLFDFEFRPVFQGFWSSGSNSSCFGVNYEQYRRGV